MNGKNYRALSAAHRAMPRARRHAGFSMIELLVAVLVMGIGVLGITALQMVSLQNNRGALMRGEASLRTYDVMDRIRANPSGNYGGVAFGDAPPAANDCMANNCTAAQMTAFDQARSIANSGDSNPAICSGAGSSMNPSARRYTRVESKASTVDSSAGPSSGSSNSQPSPLRSTTTRPSGQLAVKRLTERGSKSAMDLSRNSSSDLRRDRVR